MRTETSVPGETKGTATRRGICVRGANGLSRSMKLARTALGSPTSGGGGTKCCRLVWEPRTGELRTLATNGDIAVQGLTAPEQAVDEGPFDEALEVATVRQLSTTRLVELQLESEEKGLRVTDRESGNSWLYPRGKGLSTPTLEKIFAESANGPKAAGVERVRALAALRSMPDQEGDICRISFTPEGLYAWATAATSVGPDYHPDARLAETVTDVENSETVFGISRRTLTAIFRTMRSRLLYMKIEAADRPLRIWASDHSEAAVIAAKRLG